MCLRFRPAQPKDLEECYEVLKLWGRARYDEDVWPALPDLWSKMIKRRSLVFAVIEDETCPSGERIRAFESVVFIGSRDADNLQDAPQSGVANDIYRQILQTGTGILDWPAVRDANSSGGLNLLILERALVNPLSSSPEVLAILASLNQAFYFNFSGYRIRSIHHETWQQEQTEHLRRAGWRLRDVPADAAIQPSRMLGLNRTEAHASPGSCLSMLFLEQAPRFNFTPSQQDLLLQALLNRSDDEIAANFFISPNTVKKHWQEIFERVGLCRPPWFPSPSRGGEDSRRGLEKRRHLLDYLRQHMEELRPYLRHKSSQIGQDDHFPPMAGLPQGG